MKQIYFLFLIFLLPAVALAQPANDDCAAAITITVQPTNGTNYTAFDTRTATASTPSPECTGFSADDDIWYSFVATEEELVFSYRSYFPIGNSTGLGYEVKTTCAADTAINCDFSVPVTAAGTGSQLMPNSGNQATPTFVVGDTYVIRIYAQGSAAQATGEFAIIGSPENDECANAVPIAVQNPTQVNYTSFNTLLATRSAPAPTCTGTSADDDIWYSFVAPATQLTIAYRNFTPQGTSSGLGYQVVEDCTAAASVNCDFSVPVTDSGAALQTIPIAGNTTTTGLTVGQTYLIRIFAQGSTAQAFGEFAIVTPPANDECDAALTLPVSAAGSCTPTTVTTTFATRSARDPDCSEFSANDDLFYTFTADGTTQLLTFSNFTPDEFTSASSGPGYELLDGCTGDFLECEFTTDVSSGSAEITFAPSTPLVAGNDYILRFFLQGSTGQGSVDVCLETVSCSPPVAAATTVEFDNCPNGTPTINIEVTDLGSFTTLTLNNDGGAPAITVDAIGTYNVGPFDAEGLINFTLDNDTDALCNLEIGNFNIFCRAENNSCATAETVMVNPMGDNTFTATASNFYATNSTFSTDPSCGNYAGGDLWYRFTALTPTVTLNSIDNDWSSISAVIYNDDCDAGTEVACDFVPNEEDRTFAGLTPGTDYLLRVFDFNDDQSGMATFSLQADISLPATLADFSGRAEGKQNRIEWTTETESGVSHFELERRAADELNWTMLDKLPATNVEQRDAAYVLMDAQPTAMTYYRLRTVDFDGAVATSPIISVERTDLAEGTTLDVFPNPVSTKLTVAYRLAVPTATLTLTDATGRVVRQRAIETGAGRLMLDVADVTPGFYLLRLDAAGERMVRKVIVE
ncbi:T9SS type A sorting domain-containing protein [Lewinella sp. 4G2]|uniref:T9SS type A sorting domain-containing protein n=1 Tax=Lewinella sp. 4G2 TaxID=1803372 RepID=UPI0007B4C4D0|nr:T9SS type A sorting domain-containing protein [Lewinella sp. 4G2]OAV43610.1 hypothetical protein A3850_003465 [Lewinella sp. 4G2]